MLSLKSNHTMQILGRRHEIQLMLRHFIPVIKYPTQFYYS